MYGLLFFEDDSWVSAFPSRLGIFTAILRISSYTHLFIQDASVSPFANFVKTIRTTYVRVRALMSGRLSPIGESVITLYKKDSQAPTWRCEIEKSNRVSSQKASHKNTKEHEDDEIFFFFFCCCLGLFLGSRSKSKIWGDLDNHGESKHEDVTIVIIQ